MSIPIPEQCCPYCGYLCNRTDDAFDEPSPPRAGDVSVCFRCTEISFFDESLRLRRPLPIEVENFRRQSPELWKQIERIRAAKRIIAELN